MLCSSTLGEGLLLLLQWRMGDEVGHLEPGSRVVEGREPTSGSGDS